NIRAWLPRLNRLIWLDESPRVHARLTLSPDAVRLAVTEFTPEDRRYQTRVLEIATGREVRPPLVHATRVDTVAFRHSHDSLTFLEAGGIQREWNLQTGAESLAELPMKRPLGWNAISPDGSLAVLSTPAGIQLWNLDQHTAGPVVFPDSQDGNPLFSFTPDGRFVVSIRQTRDPQKSRELQAYDIARQEGSFWELAPDGTWNFSVVKDHPFLVCRDRLWRKPATPFEKVTSDAALGIMAADPTNELFAISRATESDVARIWSTRNSSWVGQPLEGRSVQLSGNNGVAAGVTDHALRIWRLAGYAAASDDRDPLRPTPTVELMQFMRLVELGTGKRLDERGLFVVLSAAEWKERLRSSENPLQHSPANR
ncbi:MAG TPA: WD40 repeat domain-containing protein, partial [Planctomycetaceae bacterium]|nr:WD40 repeat domain-containing protein [Planctomycetaceae bacterium]